ncbi:MAG: class I SAM-dependent methyltransferase [Spirochaetia bacterium]|nr:class I SAM-dependent methyltransferase [Spirochaetia bacterium]
MNNLEIWEEIFSNNDWGKYPSIPLVRFVARNFYKAKERENIKLLELGTGPGANIWFMAREGFKVYALEGSQTACEQLAERLKKEGLSDRIGAIHSGDYFEKIDLFEDNYFDGVLDCESLYCNSFARTREMIIKIFRKLKQGGWFYSQTFADGTWGLDASEIDYHAVSPVEGPMRNKGFSRYTTRNDIEGLYKLPDNEIVNVERIDQHCNNGKIIKEWIIEVRKN